MQGVSTSPVRPDTGLKARDSIEARIDEDSVRFAHWRAARTIPLTPELQANAYRDPLARELVLRARRARLAQDSTLTAYDAMAHERLTVGLGIGSVGREKLFLRNETASHVRWQRGRGAVVDVVGARSAFPMLTPGVHVMSDMLHIDAIPYYPGRESLLRLMGTNRANDSQNNEDVLINPLTTGAEAYYRFQTGDSVSFLLPDGTRGRLREVKVEARIPRFDLIVGSLWFDLRTAQLVRAVYRPSQPLDVVKFVEATDAEGFEDVPKLVKPMIFPMSFDVTALTVEYDLHEQRWWLPRLETVEGRMRVGFMRAPFSVEQSYRYASVNGTDALPPIFGSAFDSALSAEKDSTRRMRNEAMKAAMSDTSKEARAQRRAEHEKRRADGNEFSALDCTLGDTIQRHSVRYHGALPIVVRIPCDTAMLVHSKEFSPSIYDAGEETFGTKDREQLEKSLGFGLQAGWNPQQPTLHYGVDRGMLRYNRVEALSAGVLLESTLGSGYVAVASARIGIADWQPNAEFHLQRSNGDRTYSLGGYRRLNSANDWGDPLSVGASISSLLWAHDEGFYFRSAGAELASTTQRDGAITWRLFAERQDDAEKHTNVSLWHALGGAGFIPNFRAQDASIFGVGARYLESFGLDPSGLRTTVDVRGEGGTGTFDYGRASAEATATHGLGAKLEGALTASIGGSLGSVPVQRLWFLGGVATVRGQEPGTQPGDAYWLGRAEIGRSFQGFRPTIFYDIGWAGTRDAFAKSGRPISGAGVGVSALDGLIRFDVAHGINPNHALRADLYTSARF
ncbi:MAG: outer membrane protein assembly factor [Gemmatimonadota bacterium]|nr:outer membrane protein assembly factor [Gemmatimonadota bacterium]